MALVPIFHARVSDDGTRLEFIEAERHLRRGYLRTMPGQLVDVVIRRHRNKRSDKQNAWHWSVAVPLIAHELGYDKHEHEDVHYALVAKCFGTKFDAKLQQEIPNVRSSQLTTDEFSQLMEWEVRFAAQELGIVVPLPNEVAA